MGLATVLVFLGVSSSTTKSSTLAFLVLVGSLKAFEDKIGVFTLVCSVRREPISEFNSSSSLSDSMTFFLNRFNELLGSFSFSSALIGVSSGFLAVDAGVVDGLAVAEGLDGVNGLAAGPE